MSNDQSYNNHTYKTEHRYCGAVILVSALLIDSNSKLAPHASLCLRCMMDLFQQQSNPKKYCRPFPDSLHLHALHVVQDWLLMFVAAETSSLRLEY